MMKKKKEENKTSLNLNKSDKDYIESIPSISTRKKSKSNINNNILLNVDDVDIPPVLRAVSYICMTPKLKVKSKDVIKQRIAAYES